MRQKRDRIGSNPEDVCKPIERRLDGNGIQDVHIGLVVEPRFAERDRVLLRDLVGIAGELRRECESDAIRRTQVRFQRLRTDPRSEIGIAGRTGFVERFGATPSSRR